MPSPTINKCPRLAEPYGAAAARTEHHLRRLDRRFPASVASKKRAVNADRLVVTPRVTSATIAGQTSPKDASSPAWKRIEGGTGW